MEAYETGSWEHYEAWIRTALGGNFIWKIRPADTVLNRQMIADLVREELARNHGVFPANNVFIECVDD